VRRDGVREAMAMADEQFRATVRKNGYEGKRLSAVFHYLRTLSVNASAEGAADTGRGITNRRRREKFRTA
jgi:hypothetical protein